MSTPFNSVGKFTEEKEALIKQAHEYLYQAKKYKLQMTLNRVAAREYSEKVSEGPFSYYYLGSHPFRRDAEGHAENQDKARKYDDLTRKTREEMRSSERLAYDACEKLSVDELETSGLKERLRQQYQTLCSQVSRLQEEIRAYENKAHEFEDEMHQCKDKVRKLESEIVKLQREIETLQDLIGALQWNRFQEKMHHSQEKLCHSQEQLCHSQEQLCHSQEEVHYYEEQTHHSEKQMQQYTRKASHLKSLMEESEESKRILCERFNFLK
jgi:chromosome segregation ATPase